MLRIPFLKKPVERELKVPLPVDHPTVAGAQFAARYVGKRLSGDFFDVSKIGERFIFMVLDISGEREYAMNVAAIVQLVFRESCEDLFSAEAANESEALTQLSLSINRALIEITGSAHLCSAFFGCYRESIGTLSYINAGHTPVLVKDSKGITELSPHGLPLGLFFHAAHDAEMFVLEPGAVLLLYSRGVMEVLSHKKQVGTGRIRKVLAGCDHKDALTLCNDILQVVSKHAEGGRPDNDLTAIALRRNDTLAAHV